MTVRLVALMSVVLLLSLAAVGVLLHHYQEQFMQEVQTTASDVGQAALRTLEWTDGGEVHSVVADPAAAGGEPGPPPPLRTEHTAELVVELDEEEAGLRRVDRIKHVITTTTEDSAFVVNEQMIYPADAFPSVLPGEALDEGFRACLEARRAGPSAEQERVFISVEDVRAEADPRRGLVLKIPKFTKTDEEPGSEKTPPAGAVRYEFKPFHDGAEAQVFLARLDEIQLPIRGNYEQLFSRLRNRSLFLFMGVFLVGTVLSAGLATRFTRPVRKLDAGIRRLSEGDLDARVPVGGRGEIGRLARAFNEMADRLRANREREREMVRREKLSALGRLAAGVAHDVRNPLHSIGLTLEHLREAGRPESTERAEEFDRSLDVIRGEIRRLDGIVGNFLRFAKSERHERRPTDVGELLRDTLQLVGKEAEHRRVRIELEVGSPLPSVTLDCEAVRSAVLNLILNGFEAMPDGGTLSVSLHAEGAEVVLEVADTGQGIPEEEQERVFDFAYTTREGGNGLGLAMVHHCVVEEHGGRVGLESRPGEGTRVRVSLPAGEGELS
jgi:signal transduction histidine kinase